MLAGSAVVRNQSAIGTGLDLVPVARRSPPPLLRHHALDLIVHSILSTISRCLVPRPPEHASRRFRRESNVHLNEGSYEFADGVLFGEMHED